MGSAIDAITPSGYTPISLALQTGADALPDGDTAIVLVSDGEDTCDTPPCDTATNLKKTHPGLTISTVGFKVDGAAADQLRCI
ncbi:vWA domain-containing protein, partial [Mycolicibacterium insubricum]